MNLQSKRTNIFFHNLSRQSEVLDVLSINLQYLSTLDVVEIDGDGYEIVYVLFPCKTF